jgi:hypothetical protein
MMAGAAVLLSVLSTPALGQAGPPTLPPLDPAARVTVVSACPGLVGQLLPEQFNAYVALQDQLMATLATVQTYAKPQLGPSNGTRAIEEDLANLSKEFGRIGIGGPWNSPTVFIEVVGSSSDHQRHADALTTAMRNTSSRPDRTVVCPIITSEARRSSIANALRSRFAGTDPAAQQFYGTSITSEGRVGVQLRSDATALATELSRSYGDDIAISLGNFSWPDPGAPGPSADLAMRCSDVPTNQPAANARDVRWTGLKALSVPSGKSFNVTVKVTNMTKKALEFDHLRAVVTRAGNQQVVATARTLRYTANIVMLTPGVTTVTVAAGTDSCDASTGWALPPGKYSLYLTSARSSSKVFTSPPIPLTVR